MNGKNQIIIGSKVLIFPHTYVTESVSDNYILWKDSLVWGDSLVSQPIPEAVLYATHNNLRTDRPGFDVAGVLWNERRSCFRLYGDSLPHVDRIEPFALDPDRPTCVIREIQRGECFIDFDVEPIHSDYSLDRVYIRVVGLQGYVIQDVTFCMQQKYRPIGRLPR